MIEHQPRAARAARVLVHHHSHVDSDAIFVSQNRDEIAVKPRNEIGAAPNAKLYFVGLAFLYAASSSMIHGVGRDAAFVARRISEKLAAGALSHVV